MSPGTFDAAEILGLRMPTDRQHVVLLQILLPSDEVSLCSPVSHAAVLRRRTSEDKQSEDTSSHAFNPRRLQQLRPTSQRGRGRGQGQKGD